MIKYPDTKEIKKRLQKTKPHIKLLGEYVNMSTPAKFKCVIHKTTELVAPKIVLQRINGCPICANRHRQKMPIKERFMSYVKKMPSGCWEWQGSRVKPDNKYGAFLYPLLGNKAHRVSYWLFKSQFDTKLYVCHHCDNPICVNPDHLFLGTQQDNVNDRENKGRNFVPKGSNNGNSKLSNSQAELILLLGLEMKRKAKNSRSGYTKILAKQFNVVPSLVADIVTGKIWPMLNQPRRLYEERSNKEVRKWISRLEQKIKDEQ